MEYLGLILIVYLMNVFPAFMPPTWLVLAYFYLNFHLNILLVVFFGAVFASIGRISLTKIAHRWFRPFIPQSFLDRYQPIKNYIDLHPHFSLPLMFVYGFLPIPSNQVFVFFGLANIRVRLFLICFFFARLISYSFWILSAKFFIKSLDSIFLDKLFSSDTLFKELIGFSSLYIIAFIPWKRLFKIIK